MAEENPDRHAADLWIRILKWLGLGLITIILIAAVAIWVAIGTQGGRLWLANTSIELINRSDAMEIQIEELQSQSIDELTFSSLLVTRNGTLWLDAKRLHLSWQPRALLGRQLIVDQLQLAQLHIYGVESDSDQSAQPSGDLFEFESFDLPEVQITEFELNQLSFLSPSIGNNQVVIPDIQLSGSIHRLEDSPFQAEFNAVLGAENPTNIELEVTQDREHRFLFEGRVEEAPEGFMGRLAKVPTEQSINAGFRVYALSDSNEILLSIESLTVPISGRTLSAVGDTRFSHDFSQISIPEFLLSVDDTEHRIRGSLDDDKFDFSVTFEDFPLDLLSGFDLLRYQGATIEEGVLAAQVELTGTLTNPVFKTQLEIDTDLNELPLLVSLDAKGDSKNVQIDQLELTWDIATLAGSGSLDLESDSSDLRLRASNFDLERLRDFDLNVPAEVEAMLVSANGIIQGSLKDPDVDLNALISGGYLGEPFELLIDAEKSQRSVAVNSLGLSVGESDTLAVGTVDLDTLIGDFAINTETFSIEMIELVGVELPQSLKGNIEGSASVSGELSNPEVQANLNLHGTYQDIPYSAKAQGSRVGKIINIDSLNISTQENEILNIYGTVDETDIDINLNADRLPTALLSAAGLAVSPGEFSADFQIHGPMSLPQVKGYFAYTTSFFGANSNGNLADTQVGWKLHADTLEENYQFRSTFTNAGVPSGELTVDIPAKPYMDLIEKGNGSVAKQLPLDISLGGNFDLKMLSFFLDSEIHRIDGTVTTDLRVTGTAAAPEFLGWLDFEETSYENPVSGSRIESLNCKVGAISTRFELDACFAGDGDNGSYDIKGSLALPIAEDNGDIDIELRVNQASILQRPEIESEATGNIQLQGDFQSLLARGEIEVAPLEASIEANAASDIPKIEVHKVTSIEEHDQENQVDNTGPLVNLDLRVTASQQAYLRGRGLEAELQGEIYIRGTASAPRYEGEFNTVRGNVEIFGKTFELQQGLVNFANDAIGLNIQGVYDRDGQSVTAQISGTIDDLDLSFTAMPAMAEDEILAFIIFGKSVQSITPFEAIQLASAVQQLRGGSGGFDPIGAARDALGVDTLSIESETLEDESTGINVGVGKYLNEKVYLELERSPNPSQPWIGNLEIELTPNLNLESSTGGSTGIEGAELKWKRDY